MIKLIVSLTLATLTIGTLATSAFAEPPMTSQDENGTVYQDIRTGRHEQDLDESTLEGNDPGHYDGQETVTPPEACPSELQDYQRTDDDNDDQNLINQSRHYDRKQNSGK
jgi:hypothetical protein